MLHKFKICFILLAYYFKGVSFLREALITLITLSNKQNRFIVELHLSRDSVCTAITRSMATNTILTWKWNPLECCWSLDHLQDYTQSLADLSSVSCQGIVEKFLVTSNLLENPDLSIELLTVDEVNGIGTAVLSGSKCTFLDFVSGRWI